MALTAPTITGWSEFWGGSFAANGYTLVGSEPVNMFANAAKIMARSGRREVRRALYALTGATVGTTATESYKQVDGPDGITNNAALGGLRTINTVTVINRATITADQTKLQTMLNYGYSAPLSSYPTDTSGNGGGGKLD